MKSPDFSSSISNITCTSCQFRFKPTDFVKILFVIPVSIDFTRYFLFNNLSNNVVTLSIWTSEAYCFLGCFRSNGSDLYPEASFSTCSKQDTWSDLENCFSIAFRCVKHAFHCWEHVFHWEHASDFPRYKRLRPRSKLIVSELYFANNIRDIGSNIRVIGSLYTNLPQWRSECFGSVCDSKSVTRSATEYYVI